MKLLKKIIEPAIKIVFQNYNLNFNDYQNLIQIPKDTNVCDLCIPCFSLAKVMKENPIKIAEELSIKIKEIINENVEINAVNGYVNFHSNSNWLANKILIALL